MRVVEIRDESEWRALQPAWNMLLSESDSATVFLSWEWTSAWWSAYGTPGELRIFTAFDEQGVIRGIAPMRQRVLRRYGRKFPALSWLADGSNDSDYLDFLIARGWERRVIRVFLDHWSKELESGTILTINEIPENSLALAVLKELGATPANIWSESGVDCATLRLPASWDEYLAMLKPRFRTKVRSVLRNLEARPEARFGFCQTAAEAERLLPALFDLHTRRWNQDGRPGVFGWHQKRAFYAALSPQLLKRDSLRLSWLSWNGVILACQYGFLYGNTYLHLQEGYEPASEHWNVGMALRAWTIREFLQQGIREYDFLAGVGRHKLDWGAEIKRSKQVIFGARTLQNRLLWQGPEWEERIKESIKGVLPEKLMAARRKHFERQAAAPYRNGAVSPESGQQKLIAAAKVYYHLGFPVLTRRIRSRYQLEPGAGRTMASIVRRRQPAGRILYYHRVNDERDPFFPAMTTALFESQMRFLARNYRVLSLASLLEHIESGAPEIAVAVTFDDGYQDNYQNAFPILQRYQLPATIFLTTGNLDSREPLWFEQLAGAIQKTESEFLDLEIDIPRRFWLRDAAERLRANGEIFGILRRRADQERRAHLRFILRQLGARGVGERRDRMLTWDQVRLMKGRGIDFGGHTVTHPFLSRLTREQALWEVGECRRRIEHELQSPVEHFAYPSGREEDFCEDNKEVLREAGYRAAVSTIWGVNYDSTDRMELRRGGPWEEDPAVFAWKLDWYQLVNG